MKKSRYNQSLPKIYLFGFLLLIFWFLVSGTIDIQHLLIGLFSVLFITFFALDFINEINLQFLNYKKIVLLIKYIFTFIIEIIKANIHVAMIVLSPRMNISPGIIKFKTKLKNDFLKMIFANSITLTPGTLTIDIEDDECIVHFLTRENAESITHWKIENELKGLEEI